MALKKLIVLVVVVLAGGALLYALSMPAHQTGRTITIAGTPVAVDVADTEVLREQGLSGRTALPEGRGMLFIFDTDGSWGIWMKDMNFSIDVVWADASGKIITVVSDMAPDSYPQVFQPSAPARYVVELPAGFVSAHGVAVGTKIVL